MNKRGYTIFFSIMLGVIFFVLGLALANPLKETIVESRGVSYLDCTNSSISDQNKAVCTSLDIMQPLYIGVIFGLAGLLFGGAVR